MSVMARPRNRPTPCFQYGVIGECDGRGWRIGFHNLQDMGSHDSGNLRDDRNHDRISELAVRLGVRYRNAEIVGISHKTGAFAWRQPPWTVSLLGDEDLGAILVVACRQGPGHHVWRDQSVSESMSHGLVLRLVVLQILPQVRGERVFFPDPLVVEIKEPVSIPWKERFRPVRPVQDVPEPYIRSYPAEYRGSIWPFKKFIGYVREHAQD